MYQLIFDAHSGIMIKNICVTHTAKPDGDGEKERERERERRPKIPFLPTWNHGRTFPTGREKHFSTENWTKLSPVKPVAG